MLVLYYLKETLNINIVEIIGPLTRIFYTYGLNTGDWSCIAVTDYWNYANRQINIQSNLVISDSWQSCEDCIGGCTDSTASNYDEMQIMMIILVSF